MTNFQAGGGQLVKRGIRYAPTGTVNAALPGVEDLGCAPVPTQVPLTDTSFTGDFILGIDPPGVFASGTVNVPDGTAIVCEEGGAPAQGNAWGWLLIIPVGPLTRPDLTGNVPIPGGSPSTCSWNLKAVDPSTW